MKTKVVLFSAIIAAVAVSPFFALAEKADAADAKTSAAAVPATTSTPEGWTDDFEAAKKQAAAEGKDLFLVFSGSDWCGWCVRLEQEVFSQDGFFDGISKNFVPVFIDLPRDESRISKLARKQNRPLTERYRILGFPTVLLADADGVVFAQIGYEPGGPEKYLKSVAELTENGKNSPAYKTEKAIAAVPADESRVRRLDELLAASPIDVQLANIEAVNEVLDADPDGSLGYRAKYPYFTEILPLEKKINSQIYAISRQALTEIRKLENSNDEAAVNTILKRLIGESRELSALRDEIRQKQTLFSPESECGKRLRAADVQLTSVFVRFGLEEKSDEPAAE